MPQWVLFVIKGCSFTSLLFCLFRSLSEIHKNVISPLDGEEKASNVHEKHKDLKQRMRDLNQGFDRLRKITHEGFDSDSGAVLLLFYYCFVKTVLSALTCMLFY